MKRLFSFVAVLGLAMGSFAVDTAFWKPYEADELTFFLENFDSAPDAGKFSNAWKGPAGFASNRELYTAQQVSIEGWVRLDSLPERRAYVVRREAVEGTTHGFELFVEPDGRLGMTVKNAAGYVSSLTTESAVVSAGEWIHLAGVSAEKGNDLYVNGAVVAQNLLGSSEGLQVHHKNPNQKKETVAAVIMVGENLPGLVDDVRVHGGVKKIWPEPDNPWIEKLAARGLKTEGVFVPGNDPLLHLDFETTDLYSQDGIQISALGDSVDGVLGKAFSGTLTLNGSLLSKKEGAIEFWSRPRGYNNRSDRNRTILSSSFFNLYFVNSSGRFKPLTLYYRNPEGQNVFGRDALNTDVYSGQWYHYVISWSGDVVTLYVNGKKSSSADADFSKDKMTELTFGRSGFGDVDELYVYSNGLTDQEVSNAYWRYVDPSRIEAPAEPIADISYWLLPSSNTLYAQITPSGGSDSSATVHLQLRDANGKLRFRRQAAFSDEPQRFELPELASGDYQLSVKNGSKESPAKILKRQTFDWEGSTLGITDQVYPPFEPIVAKGDTVSVVARRYTLNAFGLWNSVQSLEKELLAAPMRLVAISEAGAELPWSGKLESLSAKPSLATARAKSRSAALAVESLCETEVDGMMKLTMKLSPVANPVPLQRLTLEIPLKAEIATLMQELGRGARNGYTGLIPEGDGVVWDSTKTLRDPLWLNTFTGYIWMGGPDRGLCWFAENDKGWKTAKNHDQPLMRLVRSGDRLTLEVDLVNVPGSITEERELVFGLQASPGKPLPADYRMKAETLPSVGLPVHPWGGLSCSWKSPWLEKWEVVDQVLKNLEQPGADLSWFETFAEKYDPPPVHGYRDWVQDIKIFAGRYVPAPNPAPIYFEEMHALPFIPEYKVFQDEWSLERLAEKNTTTVDMYRKTGGREINPNAPVNFVKSYQDYSLALMDEWWKRGVSIYWDNTYPKLAVNPWTSAAYVAQDGRIQPAYTLWNMRQYMKRTWNLMNYWREKGTSRDIEFVVHMTNAGLIPFFSWATCNYDMELRQNMYAKMHPDFYTTGEPFTPEYLLASSTGRHVGNYPYLVHDLFQSSLSDGAWGIADVKTEIARRSWGMRTTHEIIAGNSREFQVFNKALRQFGYGSDSVKVWNYWQEQPAFSISQDQVKGILLTRAADGEMLLVLQSWSKEPVETTIRFDAKRIGISPGVYAYEALNNHRAQLGGDVLKTVLQFPYETQVWRISRAGLPKDVIFADAFDAGCDFGWDYMPICAEFDHGRLRFGKNDITWQGKSRLIKYLNLPTFTDGSLEFSFQLENVPESRVAVMSAGLGREIKWSPNGLTHSYLDEKITLNITADPGSGWSIKAVADGKTVAEKTVGRLDTQMHKVALRTLPGGQCSLVIDGVDALKFIAPYAGSLSAFSLVVQSDPDQSFGALYLDDIALRSASPDFTALEADRSAAFARSQEIVSAQIDELKRMIYSQFGVFGSDAIYSLAMFRTPDSDVDELLQRLQSEPDVSRRAILLKVLCELPKRQQEHVDAMTAIGQPLSRLGEFKAARAKAIGLLQAWKVPSDSAAAVAETIKALQ